MICTISRIKILSVLSFLCQLSVVVLLNTILACPGIPFFSYQQPILYKESVLGVEFPSDTLS